MGKRIYIQGASGKLGKAVLEELAKHPQMGVTSDFSEAHVVLDVSAPEALDWILASCVEEKKPLIIGTTGHTDAQVEAIQQAAKVISVLHTPNFSEGMAFLHALAAGFSEELKNAEFEIFETHHTEKRDSPSGSALALAEATGRQNVPIHSERIGGSPGVHKVKISWGHEVLEFTHYALDRKAFAEGAVRAILFILNKPLGYYTLCHL